MRGASTRLRIPRGTPGFAGAQRDTILCLLHEAKLRGDGVSRADLIFEHHFTQCGARIFELEKLGYIIRHETKPGERYVRYFLLSEPEHLKPLPTYLPKGPDSRQGSLAHSPDWYERQTGKPRASVDTPAVPDLPLWKSLESE